MVQAIVDPEELRNFAARLARFNATLRDEITSISAAFAHLQETWRDQEQQDFERVFHETARVLDRFLSASDEHVPFLLQKANKAQDYLDH